MHKNEKKFKKNPPIFCLFFYVETCQKMWENVEYFWKIFLKKNLKSAYYARKWKILRKKNFPNFFFIFYVGKCWKMLEKVEKFFKDIFEKKTKKVPIMRENKIFPEKKISQFFIFVMWKNVGKCEKKIFLKKTLKSAYYVRKWKISRKKNFEFFFNFFMS